MKFLISLLLILSTNIYAKELLAIVNGNKITTDLVSKDYFLMKIQEKKIEIEKLIEKEIAIEYGLNSSMIKEKNFIQTYKHILNKSKKSENISSDLASIVKEKKIIYTNEQLRSKKGLLAFDIILDKKAKELSPTLKVLKKYYMTHKEKYNTQKMYELFHIVVKSEKDVNKIIKELKKSSTPTKTFREIASKESLAPTKKSAGYLGQYYYNNMPKEIKSAVKELKVNQYSKGFKSDFGYEIILVMGIQDKVIRNFKESQINVKEDFIKESTIKWAFEQINTIKAKAKIVIKYKG